MDPETLRVLSDFEMPEGAMWTAEAQKQLQMYLQSSTTPSNQISSAYPPTIAPCQAHAYDDIFNSNEDEDEHEHEHEHENENEHENEDDGNDTDSTVTELDPHLDANRMQDFDNDSDVEERSKSKRNSAPVVVVQPPMHCNNCKTQQTSLWRRGVDGQTLCNACALFYKLHGRSRPKNLKSNVIKTRNRASMAHPSKKKSARNQPSGSGPAIGTFPATSVPSTKIGDIPTSETPDKKVQASSTCAEGIAPGQEQLGNTSEDDVEQAKLISEMKNLLEVASSLAIKPNLSEPSLPPTTTTSSLPPPVSTPTTVPSSHWEFSSSPATPTTSSSLGQLPMVPPTSQPLFQGDYSAIENNPNYYSLLMDPNSAPFYHQTMSYFRPPTSQPQLQQQQFLDLNPSDSAWSMSSETAFMSQPGTISYVPVLVPVPFPVPTPPPCNKINNSTNINTPGPGGPFDPRHQHQQQQQQQQQAMFLLDQRQQEQGQQGQQFYQQMPWGYHRM
ncbi:hypothetical protein BG005_006277 [Podila minutissima]|nr:hypothetical protein BG005_006277 [Podila minutissima]